MNNKEDKINILKMIGESITKLVNEGEWFFYGVRECCFDVKNADEISDFIWIKLLEEKYNYPEIKLEDYYINYHNQSIEYILEEIKKEFSKSKFDLDLIRYSKDIEYKIKTIHFIENALVNIIKRGLFIGGIFWYLNDDKNISSIIPFEKLIENKEIEIYKNSFNQKYFKVLNKDMEGLLIIPEEFSFCSNYNKENTNQLGKLSTIIFMGKYEKIPPKMFYGCENIKVIIFEHSEISEIPEKAFFNCKSLKVVKGFDYIDRIKEQAFAGCESLENIYLHNVEVIEKAAFFKCKNLRDFYFNERIKSIGDLCFYGTNIGNRYRGIEIHKNTKLGKGVFLGIKDVKVYVKKSSIEDTLTKEEKKIYRFFNFENFSIF